MLTQLTKKIQALGGPNKDQPELISYNSLRKIIGWLGVSLPIILFIGGCLFAVDTKNKFIPHFLIQPSISHYYYTNMREVFVGTMCAVAMFLFCYKGYKQHDGIVANIAATSALLTALFPTNIFVLKVQSDKPYIPAIYFDGQSNVVSFITIEHNEAIHFICATLFFLSLSYMSIFLFTITDGKTTSQKLRQNKIYRTCGIVMISSLIVIATTMNCFKNKNGEPITFIFETIALWAFGISWLTKGKFMQGK